MISRTAARRQVNPCVSHELHPPAPGGLPPQLLEHDLVDELRLMIYPVVLGSGRRLFGEISANKLMRLVGNETVDDLAFLTYEPVRDS